MATFLALVAIGLGAGLLASRSSANPTRAQTRADFSLMVSQLRTDLGPCRGDAAKAVTALRAVQSGRGSRVLTRADARKAASTCVPNGDNGIWRLSLYVVPDSVRSRSLDYAVSCLGVWAQFDVAPAMLDIEKVLDGGNPKLARSDYARSAQAAVTVGRAADLGLERESVRLGLSQPQQIGLPALSLSS